MKILVIYIDRYEKRWFILILFGSIDNVKCVEMGMCEILN